MKKEDLDDLRFELQEICHGVGVEYIGLCLVSYSPHKHIAVEVQTAEQHHELLSRFKVSEMCGIFVDEMPHISHNPKKNSTTLAWKLS